jgi:chromosome segregation ATPase
VQGELDSQNKKLQSVINSTDEHSRLLVKKQKEFDTLHLDYNKTEKLYGEVCTNLEEKKAMHGEVSNNLVRTTAECSVLQKIKATLEGEISSLHEDLEKATADFDSEIDVIGLQFVVKKTTMETELTEISEKKSEIDKATKIATKKLSEMKIVIVTEEASHKKEIDEMLDTFDKELAVLKKEIAKTEALQAKDQKKLEDMKQQHKKEEEKLQTIRKQTDEFKLEVVSEMAKMKVKKQLATIDTAGLINALK